MFHLFYCLLDLCSTTFCPQMLVVGCLFLTRFFPELYKDFLGIHLLIFIKFTREVSRLIHRRVTGQNPPLEMDCVQHWHQF